MVLFQEAAAIPHCEDLIVNELFRTCDRMSTSQEGVPLAQYQSKQRLSHLAWLDSVRVIDFLERSSVAIGPIVRGLEVDC